MSNLNKICKSIQDKKLLKEWEMVSKPDIPEKDKKQKKQWVVVYVNNLPSDENGSPRIPQQANK